MSVVVRRFVSLKQMMRVICKERGNFFSWGEGCWVVFLYHVYGSWRNSCNKHFWNIFLFIGMSFHIFGPTFHSSFFLSYYLSLLLFGSFVLIELLVFSELCLVLGARKGMCVTDFFLFLFGKTIFCKKWPEMVKKAPKMEVLHFFGRIEKYHFVTEGHSPDFFIDILEHGHCLNMLVTD